MKQSYYKIPLALGKLLDGQELETCDVGESIAQNIQLMLHTNYGAHKADASYGNIISELDFELAVNNEEYITAIKSSLQKAIETYEKRLEQVTIAIQIGEDEVFNPLAKGVEIRRKAHITVNAMIRASNKSFLFKTDLIFGPVSPA